MTRSVDLGPPRIDIRTGVFAYPVRPPKYTDESEQRILEVGEVTLTKDTIGWVLRIGDKPHISMNHGDLVTLGVALIQASQR